MVADCRRLVSARRVRGRVPFIRQWRVLFLSRSTVCSSNPPIVFPPFLIRAVAGGLDFLVLLAVNAGLVLAALLLARIVDPSWGSLAAVLVAVFLPLPTTWLYFALQESGSRQGTFGDRACHLRVVDGDGERLTFARASARHAARYLTFGSFGVGWALWFFTPRRQALHDFLSGSVVVRDVPLEVVEAINAESGASVAVQGLPSVVIGPRA